MKKTPPLYWIALIVFFGIILFELSVVRNYIGYSTQNGSSPINTTAGFIYEIDIIYSPTTAYWQGFYGIVTYNANTNNSNVYEAYAGGMKRIVPLIFSCFGATGPDLYFSPWHETNLSLATMIGATTADIDAWININGSDTDSANHTFTNSSLINFGGSTVNGTSVYTYQRNAPFVDFDTVALKDSNGRLVFGQNASDFAPGFDG